MYDIVNGLDTLSTELTEANLLQEALYASELFTRVAHWAEKSGMRVGSPRLITAQSFYGEADGSESGTPDPISDPDSGDSAPDTTLSSALSQFDPEQYKIDTAGEGEESDLVDLNEFVKSLPEDVLSAPASVDGNHIGVDIPGEGYQVFSLVPSAQADDAKPPVEPDSDERFGLRDSDAAGTMDMFNQFASRMEELGLRTAASFAHNAFMRLAAKSKDEMLARLRQKRMNAGMNDVNAVLEALGFTGRMSERTKHVVVTHPKLIGAPGQLAGGSFTINQHSGRNGGVAPEAINHILKAAEYLRQQEMAAPQIPAVPQPDAGIPMMVNPKRKSSNLSGAQRLAFMESEIERNEKIGLFRRASAMELAWLRMAEEMLTDDPTMDSPDLTGSLDAAAGDQPAAGDFDETSEDYTDAYRKAKMMADFTGQQYFVAYDEQSGHYRVMTQNQLKRSKMDQGGWANFDPSHWSK